MSHSPNSLGLSSHWGLPHHYIPSMCPYPYSHLNHLLTTQHMLHNNIMGTSHGLHGLSNHVMPPGIGAFHNNVPANFSAIHGLNANSLMDNKDGSSGKWPDLFYANFSQFSYEYLINFLTTMLFIFNYKFDDQSSNTCFNIINKRIKNKENGISPSVFSKIR